MTKSEELVIQLVDCVLSENNQTLYISAEVDWSVVIEIATRQEVLAIAFDGYQKVHGKFGNTMDDLMDWLGQVPFQEQKYDCQLAAAERLAKLYDINFINTFVLKGISLSQLYPIPSHRYSCDMDCYLTFKYESMGTSSYDLGNALVESNGI